MCGIAGYMTISENRPNIKCMTASLAHRGPDAQGLFHSDDGKAGLGHRRLSIIDTNDRSNQPFHSYCDRYVISYNGEIYNYQELRQEQRQSQPLPFRFLSGLFRFFVGQFKMGVPPRQFRSGHLPSNLIHGNPEPFR